MLFRRLDRYLFREILGPLFMGFFLYTFILLLRVLFRSADLIIGSDVPPSQIGELLLLSLPNIVVLTIPMSLLLAIVISVGRLSADSELVAVRACGVSLFSLYRPVLLISALLTGLNIYLMLDVLPLGNHALQELRTEIITQGISDEIQPRVPHTGWDGRILYIFEAPPSEDRWKGVFLADSVPGRETRIDVAEWGEAEIDVSGNVRLSLTNAKTHLVDLIHPEVYKIIGHSDAQLILSATRGRRAATSSVKRGLRELPLRDVYARASDPRAPDEIHRMAQVELHKRFGIPFACLVFGLIGLPLGFTSARGGRASGFAISIFVFLVYYVLLSAGEDFARKGNAPAWLAVWLPNVVLLIWGLFLLARRNRDKSLLLTRLDHWIREHVGTRARRFRERREARRQSRLEETVTRGRVRAGLVVRLPEWRLPFPTLVDRYILTTFLQVLALASLSGLSVYIVADLTEKIDEILKYDVSQSVVAGYYANKSLSILFEIAPVIVMVTTLISFGLLSRNNEIVACKALGMSLYRLALPVVLVAGLTAGGCALLEAEVLPVTNDRVAELDNVIRGRNPRQYVRGDRRWLYGKKGGYLYNYADFDEEKQELQRLQVFKFDREYHLTDRLVAETATYAGEGWWTLTNGWVRSFDGSQVSEYRPFAEPMKHYLPEPPEFFSGEVRLPEEMSYIELREHIEDVKGFGGQDTAPLEVELYNKLAYPVISFVMALVALPFAFRLGRQGALYGIGLSLVLGIVLLMVLAIFSAMGRGEILPPIVAVWSPHMIFGIFSLYLFLGVRT